MNFWWRSPKESLPIEIYTFIEDRVKKLIVTNDQKSIPSGYQIQHISKYYIHYSKKGSQDIILFDKEHDLIEVVQFIKAKTNQTALKHIYDLENSWWVWMTNKLKIENIYKNLNIFKIWKPTQALITN